jgi:hypothetical protein
MGLTLALGRIMNHSEHFDARLGEQAKKNHAVIMVKIHRILADTFCCATRANRANRCNFAMRKHALAAYSPSIQPNALQPGESERYGVTFHRLTRGGGPSTSVEAADEKRDRMEGEVLMNLFSIMSAVDVIIPYKYFGAFLLAVQSSQLPFLRCSHDLDGESLGQRHDLGGPLSILYLTCL